MKWLLALAVVVVLFFHQDVWNWKDATLVFGFLPKGLAYHAGYSFVAAGLMALLVKFAWPSHLEVQVKDLPETTMEDMH